jgi:hypothetical protein
MNPQARELLAARARRAALIRRRVVATTLSAFVLAWCVIAFDGSMGAKATTTASAATASSASATSSAADSTASGSSDGPAAVTTSQS